MADTSRKSDDRSGLRCPACDYALTGLRASLRELVCPECGKGYEAALAASRRSRWRWTITAVILLVVYGPHTWIFFIDYPWGEYRWLWVKLFPAMPLMLVAALLARLVPFEIDHPATVAIMSVLSMVLVFGLTWLAGRGWRWLAILAPIVLGLASVNAWILHGLFLM